MTEIACYCRVSTEDQLLDRQRERTAQYAEDRLGAGLAELEYYEDMSTGTNVDRGSLKLAEPLTRRWRGQRVGEVLLSNVLEVIDEDRLLYGLWVHLHEVLGPVQPGAVMASACHEHEAPIKPVLWLRVVSGEGDQDRKAIGVVTGAVEPRVCMSVDDDVLLGVFISPRDDGNGILGGEVVPFFILQLEVNLEFIKDPLLSGAVHDFDEERPVYPTDIELRSVRIQTEITDAR